MMRELGAISEAPAFPLAAGAIAPLRAKAEAAGSGDFSPLWSGQAASLGVEMPARELIRKLASEAQAAPVAERAPALNRACRKRTSRQAHKRPIFRRPVDDGRSAVASP